MFNNEVVIVPSRCSIRVFFLKLAAQEPVDRVLNVAQAASSGVIVLPRHLLKYIRNCGSGVNPACQFVRSLSIG